MLLLLPLFSCSSNSNSDDESEENGSKKTIVGKWKCYENAYGYKWEQPMIFVFEKNKTGYHSETEDGRNRKYDFDYRIEGDYVIINKKEVQYELSKNGKELTLYGLDNDDMAELHLQRVK